MTIAWSEIEAECGNYREGFVAVFRRYEGQPTDEKDGHGRTVKVTMASFARHVGIDDATFGRWARNVAQSVQPERRAEMDDTRARSALRRLTPERKAEVVRELIEDEAVAEKAAGHMARATNRLYQKQADRTERITREDPVARRIDSAEWINRLGESAERFQRDTVEALSHVGELPESERFWLTGSLRRARQAVEAAERYVELGRPEIDAELQQLIENG